MAKRILIIEDEPVMLKTLERLLSNQGYEVKTALDGKEGMALIGRYAFDLVLTDVMVPYVPGTEIVSKIRHELKNDQVPIIVISSVGLESMISEAFELGASDFIRKPVIPSELVARVVKFLQ